MPRITTATKTVRSTRAAAVPAKTRGGTAAKKTPAAKKTVARKVAVKKVVRKTPVKRVKAPLSVTPTKYTYSKATLLQELTDMSADSEVTLKQTKAVMAALETLILGAVHKRGVGEFSLPGLFKITTKKVPAKKGGQKKISPFSGLEIVTKAKPATVRVRVRAGSKMKQAATQ